MEYYIEQGGQFNSVANINASNTTISFIKPFSSVVLVLGGFTKTSNNGSYGQNIFQNGATTLTGSVVSLPAYSNSGNIQHSISAAIGYWYASGY